jgi:hypothetical protein
MALSLGLGLGLTSIAVDRSGVSYSAEATALFARFTTPPTTPRKALIDALIVSLKTAGVWAKLDALYLTAAATSQAARQNWVQDLYNISAVNAPTFTADRGYAGDGSSSYLDSNFNMATAGGLFALNSSHLSVWDRTARVGANSVEIGGRKADSTSFSSITIRSTANQQIGDQQDAAGFTAAVASSVGQALTSRSASNAMAQYRDGASIATSAVASVSLPSANIFICARSNAGTPEAFSADQIAAASFGSNLTGPDVASMYSALSTYLTAVGAA